MALVRGDTANILSTALEEFRQALIRRWREHVTEAVLDGRDYPTAILAEAPPGYQPPWDYRHPHAQAHEAALEQAHDEMVVLAKWLGLVPTPGSGATPALSDPTQLPDTVDSIKYEKERDSSWWNGWTGLLADTAGSNFFSSVRHTLNNQATIAGALANLYSDRGQIIAKGRNDPLHMIQQASCCTVSSRPPPAAT